LGHPARDAQVEPAHQTPFEPECNAALAEIVGVNSTSTLSPPASGCGSYITHAPRGVGDDLVLVLEPDAKGALGSSFRHDTGKLQ